MQNKNTVWQPNTYNSLNLVPIISAMIEDAHVRCYKENNDRNWNSHKLIRLSYIHTFFYS